MSAHQFRVVLGFIGVHLIFVFRWIWWDLLIKYSNKQSNGNRHFHALLMSSCWDVCWLKPIHAMLRSLMNFMGQLWIYNLQHSFLGETICWWKREPTHGAKMLQSSVYFLWSGQFSFNKKSKHMKHSHHECCAGRNPFFATATGSIAAPPQQWQRRFKCKCQTQTWKCTPMWTVYCILAMENANKIHCINFLPVCVEPKPPVRMETLGLGQVYRGHYPRGSLDCPCFIWTA